MSFLPSSSISRHQSNRGRGRGDIHHQTQKYQSRASTTPSPGLISSNFQGHSAKTHLPLTVTQPNRVLLPGTGAQMMYSMGASGPVVPNMMRAAAPQQMFTAQQYSGVHVPWSYVPSSHSTQQPINLGTQPHSNLSMQQTITHQSHAMPMAMVAPRGTSNMMVFPTPEQAQPQSQPPQQHLQSDSATRQKRPSKAIKIVNPDTHTEVDVRGGNQETKAVRPVAGEAGTNLMAQEFRSKVHAAFVGLPGEPVGGGSVMGGVASGVFIPEMHRPNAIITDPDASKPKQVGVAYQSIEYIVQDVVGEEGAQSGIGGGEQVSLEKTIEVDMVDSSGGVEPTMTAEGEKEEKEDVVRVYASGGSGNGVQGEKSRNLDDEVLLSSCSGGLMSVDNGATCSGGLGIDGGGTSSGGLMSVDSSATSSGGLISVDSGATSNGCLISVDSDATSSGGLISVDSGAISSGGFDVDSGGVNVDNGATSSGGLGVDNDATSSGGLRVDNGATSSGGLRVDSGATSSGGLGVDSGATSSGGLGVDNGATSSGGLGVDNGATSSGGLGVDSGATSSGGLGVDNGATSSGGLCVDSGATSSGGLGVDSGATSSGGLGVDNDATSSGGLGVDSGATSSGGLGVDNDATSSGGLGVDSGATSSGGLGVDSGATSSGGLGVDSGGVSVDNVATSSGSQLADHTGIIFPEIGMSTIGEASPTNIETVAAATPRSSTVVPMDARGVAELGSGSREHPAENLNSEPATGGKKPESALLTSAIAPEQVCPIRDVLPEPIPPKSVPPQEPVPPTNPTHPPTVAPTSLDECVDGLEGVVEEASEAAEKTSRQTSQPSSAAPEKEGVVKSTVSNKAISDHTEKMMGPNKRNNLNGGIAEPIEQAKAVSGNWMKVDPPRSSPTHHAPTWATGNEGEEETVLNNAGDGSRRMYERDFLMQFKDRDICKEMPAGLKSSIVLSMDTLCAGSGGGGGGGGGGYTRPSEKRGPIGSRRIIDHKKVISHQPQMERKVVLNKASVPWTRTTADNADELTEEQVQTAELYRKFQGILNKLTPQKFTALAKQALDLEINNEERLSGCIDKIFTKALEEPSFSIAYANLCKVMSPIKAEWVLEGKTRTNSFRRMLLTKCQKEFQKDDESLETMQAEIDKAETEEKRKILMSGLTIAMNRMRKRSLGNIRFIGELFKLQMLSETILHECITRLLKSTSDEESLECFARLITTTGKDLDKQQAKSRIDTYFNRITDIIKKGKVPARVRFMLQDIIELRKNKWIPRERQDQQLKTIDQIHAEAKLEEAKEKEMVQQHQVISIKGGGGGGRDFRRGIKDDYPAKGRERFEATKLTKLINSRQKDKASTGQSHLGPMRPSLSGWKKGSAINSNSNSQPVEPPKILKPSTRSVSGPGSKPRVEGRQQVSRNNVVLAPKRSHTAPTPEYEREGMLSAANEFANPSLTKTHASAPTDPQEYAPSRDAPAQAILCSDTRLTAAPSTSTDDEHMMTIVQRKITSTIDELANNADYKEAIECVKEIDLPGAMRQLVFEGINHTLERKAEFRAVTGELFSQLVQQKVISPQDFSEGLDKVLEVAEDMCIDIPKYWDYLGEVLAPVFARGNISLSFFKNPNLVESGYAPLLAAKVLQRCGKVLDGSEEVVKNLWLHSGLHWNDLGKEKEDLEEFLEKHNLSFLVVKEEIAAVKELPKSKLDALHQLLISSSASNDDVNTWIKKNCSELDYSSLVISLSSAVVRSTVTGSGDSAIFKADLFDKRMEVVKAICKEAICKEQEHRGVDVLYGLQCSVAKLSHPPNLLYEMFNVVYNLDLVDEKEFYSWENGAKVMYGKGNAVHSVKRFFDWLKSDESLDHT